MSRADAARIAGISLGETQLIDKDDAREPPPPEAFEPIPALAGPASTTSEEPAMAKRAKPGDGNSGVTNLTEAKAVVKESVAKILALKSQRKEINAAIGEQRARVKNYGVPPAALDLAIRMKEADPEDRQKHDEGYAIARDALGLGLQRSLFETIESSDAPPQKAPAEPKGEIAKAASKAGMIPGVESLAKSRSHLSPVPDAVN
jgi:hypothetical protein